ncbi:hypothetical protein CVR97_27375, partial [Salmonella enterica subsp. enterica serovar Typhimurium]|uniref:hypothetical protein n=1 Tax=Salmonella enterica TaxID=28901 RepID=UPI000C2285FD
MTEKLQLTDLMKDQEQYEVKNDVTEELEIERLGASITIREPERSLIMDSTDLADGGGNGHEADAFLVHNIVTEPNLKDKELQKAYGCVEPTDIVHKLFK